MRLSLGLRRSSLSGEARRSLLGPLSICGLLSLSGCQEKAQPVLEPPVVIDAGPRGLLDPADCRTHVANLETGEVVRKPGPFARASVEKNEAVLREGQVVTFHTPLSDGGAVAEGPTASAILPHKVFVLAGQKVHAFDRKTGALSYTLPGEGVRSLLALPGELVLVGKPDLAVAYTAKTGKEVFRVPLSANRANAKDTNAKSSAFAAPELYDERIVVFRGTSTDKPSLVLVDPPLAKGTLATSSNARRDLPLSALTVFGARAAPGDLFVVTTSELSRVNHGTSEEHPEGQITWKAEIPFATARAVTVLDTEDLVVLAGFDPATPSVVAVVAFEAVGDSFRERYRLHVKPHSSAKACTQEVALGRPAKELIVAVACGESSVTTTFDASSGILHKRLEHVPEKLPPGAAPLEDGGTDAR
jgi:hypothetical protein